MTTKTASKKPNEVDPNWRKKYPNLKSYYANNFDSNYYEFDEYELTHDPSETSAEIEKYKDDPKKKEEEFIKCYNSFAYFCQKYVKIQHPTRGLMPFVLFKYQRRVVEDYEKHRFSIIRKFRQGGLTTVTVVWSLWRCLFKLDESIMVVSKSDREAIAAGEIVKRALEELPSWMRPSMDKNNDHQKFFDETGCQLCFYTPEAVRGRAITYLVLDEAAFVPNMEYHWKAIFPSVSAGGNCIAISTVNGIGNWYEETYHAAEKGENDFHIIDLMYTEHPDYNDDEWVRQMRAQLGEKGWLQEVMGDFMGGGDTWIPPDILVDYEQNIMEVEPARILFESEASKLSKYERSGRKRDPGAFYVWKEPQDGREYIMGVDAAEGIGAEGDNSCFQVVDIATCEQVAEFYSNTIPTHFFATVVAQVGVMYNNALVVVENEKYGATVLSRLQFDLFYENIYETVQGNSTKIGIKTTASNRVSLLDALKTRLITKSLPIWSRRLIKELKTFIIDPKSKKIAAANGGHDDAILALCLALYARDTQFRQAPVGADNTPNEMTDKFKAQMLEEIKKELSKDAPGNWGLFEDDETDTLLDSEYDGIPTSIVNKYRRSHDRILREFGW